MKHGSLFSGIGGFDLAAQMMGWNNVFHCEWMPFPRRVLSHYWPEAASYHDITTTDFSIHRGEIDILTGGFPCQPYSAAGKRKGKDDDRHLWPHMLRAIREIRPRYVVGENVFGLVTWNAGMVFEEVCADLEAEGYTVQPFILPAAAVNAPHRRDRVWFVAYAKVLGCAKRRQGSKCTRPECKQERHALRGISTTTCEERHAPDTDGYRCERRMHANEPVQTKRHASQCDALVDGWNTWQDFPTVAPICSGDDGIPRELDGITFPKWRAESIKGYGNAIVPQVALQIFRAIQAYDNL